MTATVRDTQTPKFNIDNPNPLLQGACQITINDAMRKELIALIETSASGQDSPHLYAFAKQLRRHPVKVREMRKSLIKSEDR